MKSKSLHLKKSRRPPFPPSISIDIGRGHKIELWRCVSHNGLEIWKFERNGKGFDLYWSPSGSKITILQEE